MGESVYESYNIFRVGSFFNFVPCAFNILYKKPQALAFNFEKRCNRHFGFGCG